MSPSLSSDKGLPANLEAERFVLGSILMDDASYIQCAGVLEPDDFSLEKHRRIFVRMGDLHERGEKIDRVTLANELLRHGELESCDGIGYLVSLDDGLPQIYNLESYFRIVKDKSLLRRIIFTSQNLMNRAMMAQEDPDEILAGAEDTLLKLGESRLKTGLSSPREVISRYEGGVNAFLDPSQRVKGISTGFTKFRVGYLQQDERNRLTQALNDLVQAPIYIDDTAGAHLMEMHAKLRRQKAETGLDLVVVDYLQLMSGRGRFENRNQEISTISRGMKLLSKELNVPLLVLSQLSRAPETRQGDHRPQLSDLRESGSIEQDADVVAFIFREEVYKRDREDLKGVAELILAKQRNGPVGKIDLVFLHHLTKFENRLEDIGEGSEE
jgi:replicative DNA helicase